MVDRMDRDEFAQCVTDCRTRMGWTQEQLARKLGVTTRTVMRWERGSAPTGAGRQQIAKLLRLPVAALPTTHQPTAVTDRLVTVDHRLEELEEAVAEVIERQEAGASILQTLEDRLRAVESRLEPAGGEHANQ